MGATVVRQPQTVLDCFRALVQVAGSPPDSAGRRSIGRIRMACKRSGVRISLAPPIFRSCVRKKVTNYSHWIMDLVRPRGLRAECLCKSAALLPMAGAMILRADGARRHARSVGEVPSTPLANRNAGEFDGCCCHRRRRDMASESHESFAKEREWVRRRTYRAREEGSGERRISVSAAGCPAWSEGRRRQKENGSVRVLPRRTR